MQATSETSIPSVASESTSTSELLRPVPSPCNGYDFTHFQPYFDEHRKMREEQMSNLRRRGMSSSALVSHDQTTGLEDVNIRTDGRQTGHRSTSDFKRSHGTDFNLLRIFNSFSSYKIKYSRTSIESVENSKLLNLLCSAFDYV